MTRIAALWILVIAGCATDEVEPVTTQAVVPANADVLQQVSAPVAVGHSATVTLAPTIARSALFVVVEMSESSDPYVATVEAGGRLLSRDRPSVFTHSCGRGVEVWSLRDIDAGVTEIDVTLANSMTFRAHVFEVAGLSRFPLIDAQNVNGANVPTMQYDPQAPADPGYFALSTLVTCGTITQLDPASGFVRVGEDTHVGIAQHLPETRGLVAAHWIFDGLPYSHFTDVYR